MILKKGILVAFIGIASATSFGVFAADEGLPKAAPETGTPKTREEVKADTAKAAKEGKLNNHSQLYPDAKPTNAKTKSRATVKKETADAKKAAGGTLPTPKP